MWIVKFNDNTRHSAWNTKKKALNQIRVLKEHGLITMRFWQTAEDFTEFDETVHCEDGHYYV